MVIPLILGLASSTVAIIAAVLTFGGIIFRSKFALGGGLIIATYWVYQLNIFPTWLVVVLAFILLLMMKDLAK